MQIFNGKSMLSLELSDVKVIRLPNITLTESKMSTFSSYDKTKKQMPSQTGFASISLYIDDEQTGAAFGQQCWKNISSTGGFSSFGELDHQRRLFP